MKWRSNWNRKHCWVRQFICDCFSSSKTFDQYIWCFVSAAEATEGQFDDFDVNMCVETITVKPMYLDDQYEANDEHEPSLSITSDRENGIFYTGIVNNKSILDDNLAVKMNQDNLYSWSGKEDIKEEDVQNQSNIEFNNTSLAKDHLFK